jgi:hypothetical protein
MCAARRVSPVAATEPKPARPVQPKSKTGVRKVKSLPAARAVVYHDSFHTPPQGEYRPVTHGW